MKTCLIADGSDVVRRIAAHMLTGLGFVPREAADGPAALEGCAANMPDVILLDWHLPTGASHDFLTALRLRPQGRKPVVVYCTTDNDPVDIARALTSGADTYLLKPYNRAALSETLAEAGVA